MHCASCVKGITEALEGVPGVQQVAVNFAARTADVEGAADEGALIAAVKARGYTATVDVDPKETAKATLTLYQLRLKQAILATIVGIPLLVDMFVHWIPTPEVAHRQWFWIVIGFIVLGMMWYSGRHIYRGLWQSVKSFQGNMDTLVGMGTGAAWLFSMIVVLFPATIPTLARHVYFDTTAMLLAFITFGNALEIRARGKSSEAISQLLGLRPKTARIVRDGGDSDVPIDQIQMGDQLRLLPGEQVAVDGVVIEGDSQLNEAMLTGEPLPVHKQSGDKVYTGTINQSGSIIYKATGIGKNTTLARIIDLVQRAQNTKPNIARLVDTIAGIFVPIVLLIVMLTVIGWAIWGPQPTAGYVLTTAIAVLVIACPCALGLATPIAIMIGVGKAAQLGILIRDGNALQAITQCDVFVLDKTGTITEGKPVVTQVFSIDGDEASVIRIAACLEKQSEHPLAHAILAYAKPHESLPRLDSFKAHPGLGVSGIIENKTVLLGNRRFMQQHAIDFEALTPDYSAAVAQGKTAIYVAQDGKIAGLLIISDTIKADSKAAIQLLKSAGKRVIMLSGDNTQAAQHVAREVGIDEVIADVMPADKIDQVQLLQAQALKVAMVGDGINDAAALTQADVGVAMGAGADVAIEAADIALMTGSLQSIVDLMSLSKRVMRNIKQNLFGAFIYNSIGIVIAAGVFYPWVHMLLSPIIAGAAMALSSLTVVLNANRLRY